MKPQYIRAYRETIEGQDDSGPLRFVASTAGIKRDGMDVDPSGWRVDNYLRNPVVLWAHNYSQPPIGRAAIALDSDKLRAEVTFDAGDEFARDVERKYRQGFLNAVSVGWNTLRSDRERVLEAELLDISAVPVPGDPDALIERQARGVLSIAAEFRALLNERKAIPPHTTAKADENATWDAGAELKQVEGESKLRMMHAWVDAERDPDAKGSYKLPHHRASGEVVWRGVAAAMARLLQADTDIPDADRRGAYNHLERHYRQFEKEPPEFRALSELSALGDAEWRGMFLEGEVSMAEMRTGAVLSQRNRDDLEQAMALIRGVVERATKPPKEETEDEDEEAERALRAIAEQLTKVKV